MQPAILIIMHLVSGLFALRFPVDGRAATCRRTVGFGAPLRLRESILPDTQHDLGVGWINQAGGMHAELGLLQLA